jgi:hypothetical protein
MLRTNPIGPDLLPQNRQQDPVVETVEALRDITLDEPDNAFPRPPNLRQGGMAPASRAKPMAMVAQLRFIIRFQDTTDHFLEQFV